MGWFECYFHKCSMTRHTGSVGRHEFIQGLFGADVMFGTSLSMVRRPQRILFRKSILKVQPRELLLENGLRASVVTSVLPSVLVKILEGVRTVSRAQGQDAEYTPRSLF
jgi:hypothetical protein